MIHNVRANDTKEDTKHAWTAETYAKREKYVCVCACVCVCVCVCVQDGVSDKASRWGLGEETDYFCPFVSLG